MDNRDLARIRERFRTAMSKRMTKDFLWFELDSFDRGDQWSTSNKPAWFPKPVTNFVNFVKKYKVASISVENLKGTISPLSSQDIEAVTALQEIYDDIWYYADVSNVIRKTIERAKLLGTGAVFVTYNPNKIRGGSNERMQGAVELTSISPNHIYPDPTATRLEDCRYVFIAERKTIDWVKSQSLFRDESGRPLYDIEEIKRLRHSSSSEERGETLNRDYDTYNSNDIVNFHSYYEKRVDDGTGEVTLWVTYFADWVKLAEFELPYKSFPIVLLYDEPQVDDFWGISSCQQILQSQKVLNTVESVVVMYTTLLQQPQRLISASSNLDVSSMAKFGSAPGMNWVAQGDLGNAVRNLEPPEVNASVFSYLNTVKEQMQQITGLNSTYMGANVGSLTTSGGVNTLMNRALVLDKDYAHQLNEFIKKLSYLILETFVAFLDTKSVYYIPKRDMNPNIKARYGFIEVNMETLEKIENLDYDVIIESTSHTVDDIQKQREDAQNLMQMQMQFQSNPPLITPQEFISMSNFSNKNSIIRRLSAQSQEQQTQQMQQFVMQIMQMVTNPQMQQNPEMAQMTLQQLVEQGVNMMNPYAEEEQKLGSVAGGVGATQKKQSEPMQAYKQTNTG